MPNRKTPVQADNPEEPQPCEHATEVAARDGMTRHRRIEKAAYFRAEARGFIGGDPVQDWLLAEAEIDEVDAAQKR
jgi:hypothetical protein